MESGDPHCTFNRDLVVVSGIGTGSGAFYYNPVIKSHMLPTFSFKWDEEMQHFSEQN